MQGLPTELDLQSLTNLPISQESAFTALVLKAIYTAAVAGNTTTASISTASTQGPQVETLIKNLQSQGFAVVNNGANISVNW